MIYGHVVDFSDESCRIVHDNRDFTKWGIPTMDLLIGSVVLSMVCVVTGNELVKKIEAFLDQRAEVVNHAEYYQRYH